MDLQADETIAVIAHQALMLHRAMCADVKPEPKAVLQHIQRMQGTVLTWVQQTMPQEQAPVLRIEEKALAHIRDALVLRPYSLLASINDQGGIRVSCPQHNLGFAITYEEIADNVWSDEFYRRLDELSEIIEAKVAKPVDTVNTDLGVKPLKDKRKSNRRAA